MAFAAKRQRIDEAEKAGALLIFHMQICAGASQICFDFRRKSEICVIPSRKRSGMETIMQQSRLFKILYYLLDKGQATAPELAEKFEVSVRTIYRDVDALSGAGIPVFAEAGRSGGIRLMEHFTLDKAVLSDEEKQNILTALQSLHATQNLYNEDTVQKLSALFHLNTEDWLEVDFSRWGEKAGDHEKFELLKMAVLQHRKVKIRYAGTSGDVTERTISPLKLIYKAKAWYVKAFCLKKQGERMFKLNRILEFEIVKEETSGAASDAEQAQGRKGGAAGVQEQMQGRKGGAAEAQEWEHEENFRAAEREQSKMQGPGCCRIVLRFPGEMAYRVYDEFDATQVKQQEDGSLTASAQMPADEWLTGFLLSFGSRVEVLEPAFLKEELARQAKLIYEKNKS